MKANTSKIYTSKRIANMISKGLPAYQKQANLKYIENNNRLLGEGGLFIMPSTGLSFIKHGNDWIKN